MYHKVVSALLLLLGVLGVVAPYAFFWRFIFDMYPDDSDDGEDLDKSALIPVLIRTPLYCGFVGGLGATAGWLGWIAISLIITKPSSVAFGVAIGSVVGIVRELGARYFEISRGQDEAALRRSRSLGRGISRVAIFSIAGMVAPVVLENTFVELVRDVVVPFLFSIVTFVVAGIVVGALYVVGRELFLIRDDDTPKQFLYRMIIAYIYWPLLVGVITALAVAGTRLVSGVKTDFGGLLAWWTIISWSALPAIFTGSTSRRMGRAITLPSGFLLCVVGGLLFVSLNPVEVSTSVDFRASGMSMFFANLAEGTLKAPDVPEQAWEAAEHQITTNPKIQVVRPSFLTPVTRALSGYGGCDRIPMRPDAENPAKYLARKRLACQQIAQGSSSSFVRSVIVVLGFTVGLAVGVRFERRVRPQNYMSHKLRPYDRVALVGMSSCMVVGALILRWH